MESIGPALVTGVASIVVALVGLAASRKRARPKGQPARAEDPTVTLERRLWAAVLLIMLALVVGDAVAPLWGLRLDFPIPAYAFLISGLVFWLQLSLSRKRRNGGDDDDHD